MSDTPASSFPLTVPKLLLLLALTAAVTGVVVYFAVRPCASCDEVVKPPATAERVIKEDNHSVSAADVVSSPTPAQTQPLADSMVYTGTVVFIGKYGDGLVKVDGESVFVPGVQKGDRIRFVITERRGKFSNGKLISKLEPSGSTSVAP